jgi:cyclic-di-AMP phosphodiesterase PgpH
MLRWPERVKKKLKSYFDTEIGISVLLAWASIIIITFILSSRYLTLDNLVQNGVSTRDIVSERTLQIEDTEQTQRLRYEARQMIAPIYKKEPGADKVIMDRLVNFLENLQDIRAKRNLALADKVAAMEKLVGEKEVLRPDVLQTWATTRQWQKIYEASIQTTENLIAHGIASEEFRDKRETLVRQALPDDLNLAPDVQEAVISIVRLNLRPTLAIDEKSTEEARDITASHVKPVTEVFNKGDLIMRKGDRVTKLQLAALQKQGNLMSQNRWLSFIGIALLSVMLLSIVWGYIYRFEKSTFFKPTYVACLSTIMVCSVGSLSLLNIFQPDQLPGINPIAIFSLPITILSLMICVFTHPRIAILTTLMLLLLCGLTLKIPLESLAVLMISSLAGILVISRKPVLNDRNDLILAGFSVGIARGVILLAISFIYEPVSLIGNPELLTRVGFDVFVGLLAGVLTLGILPIIESWFRLVTPFTLLELGNHDRPILRRMQMEAPGTFHHSIMVATLSEAAAEEIGANPILTRVGALYHDIGKIKRPLFFVENQAYFGVENPHDKLTPRLSKMVITVHPRDGIEMGKQLGLPKIIMRFMPEHHGTMVAGYFYNRAVLEEGEENVNKAQFRYPGPKPQSKETAIVMLADASESAVRALKNPTSTQVEERVDKIVKQRIDDGQFSECPITFQEIQKIRDTFIRVLRGIQHNRIEYQQNMLQELGKKTSPEGLKEVNQTLKKITPPYAPLASAVEVKESPVVTEEIPGGNLDALLDATLAQAPRKVAEEETPGGPECC